MKKVLMMVLLAVSFAASATTTVSDDKRKTDVVLSEGDEGDWTMHFGLGVNVPTGVDNGYQFAPFKSWDVQWTILSYDWNPNGGSQTYAVGFGLNWSNFGLKDDGNMFVKVGDNVVGLGLFDDNMTSRMSKVHRLAINIPLLFTQDFSRNFSLTLGPVINFNTGCWLHNSYDLGDNSFDITTKKLEQRPVTVDIMGVFDIYGVGVFCKYSPMSVFKKNYGPKFSSLTFGLYF